MVEEEAKGKKMRVIRENPLRGRGGELLKPDLVITDGVRAFVVDVTVRIKRGESLASAPKEEKEKYQSLKESVSDHMQTSHFEVLPVVVGARGALPKSTVKGLKLMGLWSRSLGLTMSLGALRSSTEILNHHFDYD
jgi:hypothetical protein